MVWVVRVVRVGVQVASVETVGGVAVAAGVESNNHVVTSPN